jgi:predicted transcriptional regulator
MHHLLKRKKIKLHKIKFVSNIVNHDLLKTIKLLETTGDPILSRRYRSNVGNSNKGNNWSSEGEIINWLASIGIKIKRVNSLCFILKNRACSFNHIVIFANKKRVELGLSPFYIEGITEF